MMDRQPDLFTAYPALAAQIPWVSLTSGPTRVHRLTGLAGALGASDLWIKRDDETSPLYGGNKPRKLEFLLGDARARGLDAVLTFGGLGSNHALATAVHGARAGLRSELVLLLQPVTGHVRRNLLSLHNTGAQLRFAPTKLHAVVMAASAELSSRLRRRKPPYRIAPGGSSPVGTLGYVSAALELARQVRDGDLPQPGAVFVALGSNGTMAGLVAGMRLAGMDTKIIGVQVSDILRLSPRTVSRLANRTIGLLARVSVELAIDSISPADVTMVDGYLGNGYGHPTDEARHAVELMHRHEGIELEETYTGKTLAAMIDHVEAERPTAPVLFWNTYSSSRPHLPPDADYRDLPQAFHRFFENSDDGAA